MHCAGLSLSSRQSLLHKKSASHLIHLFTGVVLSCCALAPLYAAVPDRISAHPDLTRSQALPNHHPLWANPANSIWAVPSNTPVNQLTLVLARSPEQQTAFEQFLADQQNPASLDYHHWLTPAEVGERFGISDADIAVITSWLQSQGLTVNWIAPSKLFIGFGGSASSVNHAFQTELRTYRVNSVERMSVASDPQIPQALAPLITSIRGLYTINEQPNSYAATMQSPSPTLTLSNGAHYITPADFQVIYGGSGIASGSGETIGIVGESRTDSNDFGNFSQKTDTPFQNPTEIIPTGFGGIDPGPAYTAPPSGNVDLSLQSEATLDVTRAGSIAPSANLLLVVSTSAGGGIASATQYLVQTSPVPAQVISISFGACESAAGLSGVSFWASLFQQAAAEGISVFVSSGDSGASGCDAGFTAPPAAPQANSPNYICSSSYATCVGGTEFNDASGGYWSSSNGSNLQSALSYIPEGAWNEPQGSSGTQVAASGGGVSAYVATPSWQTGTGVPSGRVGRYTPDVSFSSSCHTPYFGCFAAAGGSCVTQSGGFSFVGYCGTSASAPSMAGFAAVLDDQLGAAQGNLNPELYQVAANAPAAFHDTTPASSGVASCDINTASMCNNSAPGISSLSGGQPGYPLTVGYDEVTGLGSLNLASLINAFTDTLIAPAVAVSPASTSVNATQSFPITVSVTAPSGDPAPTGSVHLTVGPYTSAATVLTAGSATITVPALSVPASINAYTVTADYQPDSAGSTYYRTATGTANVTVNPIVPTVTVAASSTSITTAQSDTVSATVSGPAGDPTPSGTILFNIVLLSASGGYSVSAPLASGTASATVPIGALPPGQNAINATYTPDAQGAFVYGSALNTNVVDITVTQADKTSSTVTVTPAASSITTVQSLTVNITVATSAGYPTGSVKLSSGTFTSSATQLVNGAASVVVPAGALPVGADTLTALYSGDNNTDSGMAAATVTVVAAPMVTPTLTIAPSASTVSTNDILNVAVTVNTAAGYPTPTGTITFSSGSYSQPPGTLILGSNNFTIDGSALPLGVNTLNFSYSGDSNYNPATGSTSVTVTSPAFTIAGANVTIATPGEVGISPLTITPIGNFTGSVTLSASLTSSPNGAIDLPTFTFGTPVVINSGSSVAYTTLEIQTTSPSVSTLNAPAQPRSRWYSASGATFACILVLWIPRRRRRLRNLLSMVAMLIALTAGLLACGGGGGTSGSAGKGGSAGGTTPGTYTVTITATSGATTASTSISVVVQ